MIARYLRNQRLFILIVMMIVIIGTVSFTALPRVLNPQIKIPIVIVSTVLPGAAPNDIESLVTIPIEDSLKNVNGIKTMASSSQDSVSAISLEFVSGTDPDKARTDVKSAVDSVTTLPKNAKTPSVNKLDFENTPVWTMTVSAGIDRASLTRFSRNLADALKDADSIDKVATSGLDNQEIQVLLRPEAIATYGINPFSLASAITTTTGALPAGTVNTGDSSFILSIDPTTTKIDDLRKLRISVNGSSGVALGDIATIMLRSSPDNATSYIATHTEPPVPAVTFNIFKKSSANITKAAEDARKITNKMADQYNGQIKISSVIDVAGQIDKQYNELIRDFTVTVGLVFLILIIFLGARQAVVASFAIPLTFLITFIVMRITGISLSFIAFFSFLLSLGLLVDDTIVVISAITAYYRTRKFTPMQAGLLVWRDFLTAIFTTTLTTVWAFVPLLLSTGIMGEFIKPIPIVVSSTLLASFAIAMFVTLPFIIILLKPAVPYRVILLVRILILLAFFTVFFWLAPKGPLFFLAIILFAINVFIYLQVKDTLFNKLRSRINSVSFFKVKDKWLYYLEHGVISFEKIGEKYRSILYRILAKGTNRRKVVIMVIIFSLFSYLLVPLGFVRNEFFPEDDQEYLYLTLKLPSGTNIDRTNEEGQKIIEDLRKIPEVKFANLNLRQTVDPGRGYGSAGNNNALITMVLTPLGQRSKSSIDLAEELRQRYAKYEKGTVSLVEVSGGPPAGSDLQIKLYGNDLGVLDSYAGRIEAYLHKQAGVTNIDKSIKSGTSKIVFTPDSQKILDAGLTQDQIGLWLRTYASGFTLDSNIKLEQGNTQGQDIVFRTDTRPQSVQNIDTIFIPTQKSSVPLISLGSLSLRPNPTLITRENSKRTISVTAGVTKGYSITDKNKELENFANSLNLPSGYSWSTGGVNEENQNSVTSILQAMLLSFLLIIITMVMQFSSFRKALIVMLVIPLSISGVFIVFALTHTPLSFPALIGILALFGIVVKNSILIVDKINQNLKIGMKYIDALVDASESRLEPIALTSFTAIIGLIPITLSNALWRGLGGAIIAGLVFSGTIMLFFIPVVYYLIFQNSEGKKRRK